MVQRIGGVRRKTRHKLSKKIRAKGKISFTDYFRELSPGDQVCLNAEPAVQKGMYFPRYHGKMGSVLKRVGECYQVGIKDGSKNKTLVVHPVHLKVINNG